MNGGDHSSFLRDFPAFRDDYLAVGREHLPRGRDRTLFRDNFFSASDNFLSSGGNFFPDCCEKFGCKTVTESKCRRSGEGNKRKGAQRNGAAALCRFGSQLTVEKRQRTAALQDLADFFSSSINPAFSLRGSAFAAPLRWSEKFSEKLETGATPVLLLKHADAGGGEI